MDSLEKTTDIVAANPPDVRKLTPLEQKLADLEQVALGLLAKAESLVVDSPESYQEAAKLAAAAKDMGGTFEALLRPAIQKAVATHRELLAGLKRYSVPLGDVKRLTDEGMAGWTRKQRLAAEAKAAKLREQLVKEENDRKEAHALHLEKLGKHKEADRVAAQEIPTPVVHVPTDIPKIPGLAIVRKRKARFIPGQEDIIDRSFCIPHLPLANEYARLHPNENSAPGVEFYWEETTAQGRV